MSSFFVRNRVHIARQIGHLITSQIEQTIITTLLNECGLSTLEHIYTLKFIVDVLLNMGFSVKLITVMLLLL